jgi:hypothetical protein
MNCNISHAAFGVSTSLFCLTLGAAAQINIVDAGRAGASLIMPADPHAMVREAAADLQQSVQQATRARLPFCEPDDTLEGHVPIRIGAAALAANESLATRVKDLPYDATRSAWPQKVMWRPPRDE